MSGVANDLTTSSTNIQFPLQRKQRVCIKKISWSMLFREITVVYSENHRKPINTLCGQNTVIEWKNRWVQYHCALKSKHKKRTLRQ
jgi:hypothetical protein